MTSKSDIRTNIYAGHCLSCGDDIAVHAGRLLKKSKGTKLQLVCNKCVSALALIDELTPNVFKAA